MKGALIAIGIGVLGLHAAPAGAQSAGAVADSTTPAQDSAEQGKKKGGGLIGKAKKLAGNKAVQQVAKTMACTVVPGGQVVAGAIDAASSDDVGEAAAGAAGAASGQTCMPGAMGMGEAPASAPGMPGVAGLGGLAGAAGAGMSLGAPGRGGAAAYAGMPGGFDMDAMTACMGITTEEYLIMIDPTDGSGRQPTKEELERQRQIASKVDPQQYQVCAMQQLGAGRPGMGAGAMPMSAPSEDEAPADGKLSEAPGKTVELPDDLEADVRKGRVVVKDIDWLTGGADVAEAGTAGYAEAVKSIAGAIGATGGSWRADIYLDKRYDDEAAEAIGGARLAGVVAVLEKSGLESGVVTVGKTKKDKRPRLEIVRTGK